VPAHARQRGESPLADRRLWVVGGAVALILVAVVLGVVLTSGDDTPSVAADGATLPDAAEATALFDGIAQSGTALGRPDAPVTLVEFADLQCPFCRQFAVEAMPTVVEEHIREGTVRMEFRGLSFIGPDSERGLRAVLAAGQQDRLYEMTELLYYNQGGENDGWLNDDLIQAAARSIPGVDVAQLVGDMDSGAVSDLIEEHAAEAQQRAVNSTPTVFVGRTGGDLTRVEMESATDVESITRAIEAAAP
jgi:protein-disulfide isomerase